MSKFNLLKFSCLYISSILFLRRQTLRCIPPQRYSILMTKGRLQKMLNKNKLFLIPLCLLLVGCSSQKKPGTEKQSATRTEKKVQSAAKSTQTNSQKASASQEESTTSSAAASSQSEQQASRLAQLNHELITHLGTVLLPQNDGLTSGSDKLNARYHGNAANYTVSYSVETRAKDFNDSSVAQEIPYAEFTKKTYSSATEAAQQVTHRTASDSQGLPTVDLGHNIRGYLDSGAGQRYLSWNEGNWSLSVHAAAVKNEDPTQLAKQTVAELESYLLPAPQSYGEIRFNVGLSYGSREQLVRWQKGNIIYELETHDPSTAIKMAASVK